MAQGDPATCHPTRKQRARGLCWTCNERYRAEHGSRGATPATCHPDLSTHLFTPDGQALCAGCAEKWRYRNVPSYREYKRAYAKQWKDSHREHVRQQEKWNRIRRAYGMTRQEFEARVEAQDGMCAICDGPIEAVDHDHATGEVRGLLCHLCNKGLGAFKDDPAVLMAAYGYLNATRSAARLGARL